MEFELFFSDEVRTALVLNQPVVALESTIISHGMPFPRNLEVAHEVEQVVRDHGAIPATIAILGGRVHVGLTAQELEQFAQTPDVMKCSRRDLPFVVANGGYGATTVSATMIIAHLAGIRVFATGGIGGVHRGAENTFDISADLTEFFRTPVAVVSAGAKAILDIPKTLEYLETQGVAVIGFGTDDMPAFYSRSSGQKLSLWADTPETIAAYLNAQRALGLTNGTVIANPIPEEHEIPAKEIEGFIIQAVTEAEEQNIRGKELTPFLLKRLNIITEGRSQQANRALVLNNAALAARIAATL
jgi:pseudouridine-5'-phosphate glycosidase